LIFICKHSIRFRSLNKPLAVFISVDEKGAEAVVAAAP
jgi:hypothetical protein